MQYSLPNADRFSTLWSSHEPVRRYVQTCEAVFEKEFSPAVRLSPIDAFLMREVANSYSNSTVVIDLANEATRGASIMFWASQTGIHRVVSNNLNGTSGDWMRILQSTLEESGLAKSVSWIDPSVGYVGYPGELMQSRERGYSVIFSFSGSESESISTSTRLQWLFDLSQDIVGFVFPLGQIGENGLLNDVIDFCSAAPNRRLTALREISPFLASSQVGMIYNSSNTSIPATIERIHQLFDGNFQVLRLIKDSIDSAVIKKSSSTEQEIKRTHEEELTNGGGVSLGEWCFFPDSSSIGLVKKLIPNAIKHAVKSKLVRLPTTREESGPLAMKYRIKPGYRDNERPQLYRDSIENAHGYQTEIYKRAGQIARSSGVKSVLDLGCGFATKLVQYVAPYCNDITGVDRAPEIQRCKSLHHSVGKWIAGDLEDPDFALDRVYDLIIAADVIEHLREPDRLLDIIRASSHGTTQVVLSTPERDLRRGKDHMGPPDNVCHVREWNGAEFAAYLRSRDFVIQEQRIVDLCIGMPTCQMVIGGFWAPAN